MDLPASFAARAAQGAGWVREQGAAGRTVTVVHHIDADGVTSGAIAAEALARAKVPCRMRPVKSLDAHHVAQLQDEGHAALWFCDLGSTAYMHFPATPKLVCDHHQLVRDGGEEAFPHVNPLLDGLDGGEVSGAGCAFVVAHALDARSLDLLPLALVGATADRQDRPLHGINLRYLEAAIAAGLVEASIDLSFFGPETRALTKFLSLANEPAIPGVAGDATGAERLLRDCGVDVAASRSWSTLSETQQRAVRSALAERLLDAGLASELPRLWRTVIRIRREPHGPTRELQEFGTLLNSTARYDRPDVGIAVARGDRGAMFEEALDLLDGHRKHLVGALDALAKRPIQELAGVQWVHLEDAVRDTVVGIVAGMALGGPLGLRQDLPLIAFAWTPDGRTKVSSRAPNGLKGRIDLSVALREAAASVGGAGGGHPGAAGATIGRGEEARFLAALDPIVARQLGIAISAPTALRPSRQIRLL
ncbi:MAG: DHH family phosphoesterase [Candidatus Thermoplasmatota archaeon]